MCIGVGGCGSPNSERMRRVTLTSNAFTNNSLSYALAAEADDIFKVAYVIVIVPLSLIGGPL